MRAGSFSTAMKRCEKNAPRALGFGSLALTALLCGAAAGDELQTARGAVARALRKDGGRLVDREARCPTDVGNLWEYVTRTQSFLFLGRPRRPFSTPRCGGGNKHGQYLVVVKSGRGELVRDAEIGDMSFIDRITRVEGNVISLSGVRWTLEDPHCCPSMDAVLEYDIARRIHRFKSIPRKEKD